MRTTLTLVGIMLLCSSRTLADDDEGEGGRSRATFAVLRATPGWKLYAAECATCHMAFPPRLLPARSWSKLLGGLADHFTENAEVDAATRAQLATFLEKNSGRDVSGPAPLRITALPWWKREHREVAAVTFSRKAIMTPANCGACHPGAADGDFEEDRVRIPR
jgi:hypothetical protein